MRSFRTFLCAFAVATLAACGGGPGSSSLAPAGYDPGTRAPSGSSVAFEKATLWVGYEQQLSAFSTNGNGAVTPQESLSSFRWSTSGAAPVPGIVDVAIAPDGTQWLLENRSAAEGGPGWRLDAVAPGSTEVENTYGDDVNFPFAVGLAGDGIMVGYTDSNGITTIATYPYAASNAPPIRTFRTQAKVRGFYEGNDGHLYVARTNKIDVYRPDSNGSGALRSIALDRPIGPLISPQEIAVGPDNSVYVTDLPGSNVMYVNVYPPGSGKLGRRIGPLPADYGGLGFPVITVDSKNRLYVATNAHFYRFGPGANGAATPQRVMNDSTQARPRSMSIGPAIASRQLSGTITEFPVGQRALGIASGPDGNLWFTEHDVHRIGRITPGGAVTEFSAGITGSPSPTMIAAGPDGNLWFTESSGGRIGRITTAGAITEFSSGITAGAQPNGITAGPDGNVWFTEYVGNRIGRITPAGVVTEFSGGITPNAGLTGIALGPDGNLWFTENFTDRIGRITPAGAVTEFSAGITGPAGLEGVTAGPDGNIWFTESSGNRIGRITPAGAVSEFSTGLTSGGVDPFTGQPNPPDPRGITAGPDGNLWFVEFGTDRVGRITPAGAITEFSAGIRKNSQPVSITSGPDGNIWFTEPTFGTIGRLQ
jgi:streptogramin lyase